MQQLYLLGVSCCFLMDGIRVQLQQRVIVIIGNPMVMKRRATPTYTSWRMMKSRCRDPRQASYKNYGGAGITYCHEWEEYERFLADMGERPPGKTLDRIDSTGNYKPGNCKWSTPKEQARNRRTNVLITIDGETKCLEDWGREYNRDPWLIKRRINRGWSEEDAIKAAPFSGKAAQINYVQREARAIDTSQIKEKQ